jgi:hypothetical protein
MSSVRHPYEFPFLEIAWSRGGDRAAGIFLLEGRCHIAAYDSSAARSLVERGALHVAGVRFDADPHERSHRNRRVRAVTPGALLRRMEAAAGVRWNGRGGGQVNPRESDES